SPRAKLTRYFFFPGFTKKTGGLLLEGDLLARRDVFLRDPLQQTAFWKAVLWWRGAPD
ncbi:MAG: elongation factor P maturation arginine rhamnosyltransferase EarP, partial [Gallionella sp.]|nr:elongation factor P maturation arginine rhamnosyltransferase EarP [Gallionella sp.]